MTKTRDKIDNKYKWDLSTIYKDEKALWDEYETFKKDISKYKDYKNTFLSSGKDLYEYFCFDSMMEEKLGKMYTYTARLRDEDLSNSRNSSNYEKIRNIGVLCSEENSFFMPMLLEKDYSDIEKMYKEYPKLLEYKRVLKQCFNRKDHILSKEEEKLMLSFGNPLSKFETIYDLLLDSELSFDKIKDEDGNLVEMSDTYYRKYIDSKDRNVRRGAYNSLYKSIKQYKNTFAKLLLTNAESNILYSKHRKYNTVLEHALFPNEIDTSIYKNLITTVNKHQDPMYDYFRLKKELLGLDKLHFYDVYVPIIKNSNKEYSFEEAKETVLEGLSVLGDDYTKLLKKAFNERWIDVYATPNKTGGAYSSGTYGTNPFVLLNFQGRLDDVSTLAHELGHSMHTYYSMKNQPIQTSSYTLFCAEVASTVNELILAKYMLKKSNSKEEKLSILNKLLELFKSTIYRQTMFAEFELWFYEELEKGRTLTEEDLASKYKELLKVYFADTVEIDDNIIYEWARIPHFYYEFYVYQYATGLSAACQIVKNIETLGEEGVENYKKFLRSGSSMTPIDELKLAGVDMSSKEPIESAIEFFEETLEEFKETINSEV